MRNYDNWLMNDLRDTPENARIADAYGDAGWTDNEIYKRYRELVKMYKVVSDDWSEPAIEHMVRLTRGLLRDIEEHFMYLSRLDEVPDNWDCIDMIDRLYAAMPTEVFEGVES